MRINWIRSLSSVGGESSGNKKQPSVKAKRELFVFPRCDNASPIADGRRRWFASICHTQEKEEGYIAEWPLSPLSLTQLEANPSSADCPTARQPLLPRRRSGKGLMEGAESAPQREYAGGGKGKQQFPQKYIFADFLPRIWHTVLPVLFISESATVRTLGRWR